MHVELVVRASDAGSSDTGGRDAGGSDVRGRGLPETIPLRRFHKELRARAYAERCALSAQLPFADAIGDLLCFPVHYLCELVHFRVSKEPRMGAVAILN